MAADTGLFLAVSKDTNPLDGFLPPTTSTNVGGFPDYQKPGFNKDAIFIGFNDFGSSGGNAAIATIDKAAAFGGTLSYFVSHPEPQFRAMTPAQMHGDTTGGVEWFFSTDGSDVSGDTHACHEDDQLPEQQPDVHLHVDTCCAVSGSG